MVGIGVVVVAVVLLVNGAEPQEVKFDKGFKFGAASASYQIEGAWDADEKSMNIWDEVTHRDWGYTADRSNGDEAANSYEFYQKDIDALDNVGVSEFEREHCTLMANLLSLSACIINSRNYHFSSGHGDGDMDNQKFNFL